MSRQTVFVGWLEEFEFNKLLKDRSFFSSLTLDAEEKVISRNDLIIQATSYFSTVSEENFRMVYEIEFTSISSAFD